MNNLVKYFFIFSFSCHAERRGCSNCCQFITDKCFFDSARLSFGKIILFQRRLFEVDRLQWPPLVQIHKEQIKV